MNSGTPTKMTARSKAQRSGFRLPATLVAITLMLSACGGLPQVPTGKMLLDTERQLLCYSNAASCFKLGLIIANSDRDYILRLYGKDPWDWKQLDSVEELVKLLLTRVDATDSFERLDPHRYVLPMNQRTYQTWLTLKKEYNDRYGDDDCRTSLLICH